MVLVTKPRNTNRIGQPPVRPLNQRTRKLQRVQTQFQQQQPPQQIPQQLTIRPPQAIRPSEPQRQQTQPIRPPQPVRPFVPNQQQQQARRVFSQSVDSHLFYSIFR
ncbi:unnamed protein product [Anisakis simplex]|uniref:Uncharacterized protein n=1 Tax=Anisakis simplex TaxID=6269 RepID=A0A0M3JZY9_ANISI|nr:unnamed protein product [Anisakis simplex]